MLVPQGVRPTTMISNVQDWYHRSLSPSDAGTAYTGGDSKIPVSHQNRDQVSLEEVRWMY